MFGPRVDEIVMTTSQQPWYLGTRSIVVSVDSIASQELVWGSIILWHHVSFRNESASSTTSLITMSDNSFSRFHQWQRWPGSMGVGELYGSVPENQRELQVICRSSFKHSSTSRTGPLGGDKLFGSVRSVQMDRESYT